MIGSLKKLGRLEKAFVLLALGDVGASLIPRASGIAALLTFAILILGVILLVRLAARNLNRAMWRLRNRLIVSYLFIAVFPMVLVTALVAIVGYVLIGQVAI